MKIAFRRWLEEVTNALLAVGEFLGSIAETQVEIEKI
jgi:hypothetical protein